MLIWLDILTPKQIFFLGELAKKLEDRGYNILLTTRRYHEVNELLKLKNINALLVGKHGGATLEGKLTASSQRIEELSHIINRLKPNLSVAFASPEAARTAFGLAIPHYTINDSPHSEAVARLTIPLSSKLFSPKIIPKKIWITLGASEDRIVQYNALDPIVWLKTHTPDIRVLDNLNIDISKPIIVFRTEESFASYLIGHVSEKESVIIPIIKKIKVDDVQIVALPRHSGQALALKEAFGNRIILPKKVIDGPSLLFFSSIFIGAGGTMTSEAALLGIPTISCYPKEPTFIEKYLMKENLVIRVTDPEKTIIKIIQILDNFNIFSKTQKTRAEALKSQMVDPLDIIVRVIERNFAT